ncbi:MAG: MBOAT family protein [Clostridia bacterium]|nr:MBOAT family protein [Clostridia bacterium]
MVFSSVEFLFMLFPGTLALYFLLSRLPDKAKRVRDPLLNFLLIAASLLFYAWGEPVLLILLLTSVAANWLFGLGIAHGKGRKLLLAAAVVLNIGLLGVFKYAGFATDILNSVTGLSLHVPQIALPIGISFYTFQALSYVIDVYRDPALVQKNGFRLLLYICFFPQLIAGPIVRYGDIAAQLKSRTLTLDGAMIGFRRLFIGLGKKILIADELAVLANVCFAHNAENLPMAGAWLGAIAYLLQIYFDFSGYSDMAIGMGHIFGFQFPENFNYPYASLGIKDFWRRWHITLSTWFREYLYIPLGGNRKGKTRMLLNQLIVFFCTGLWHGANLTFVVWGLYNGLFLVLESNNILPVRRVKSTIGKLLVRVYTLLTVTIGFVIFRADNLTVAVRYLGRMFSFDGGWWGDVLPCLTPYFFTILGLAVIGAAPLTPALKRLCDTRPRLDGAAQRLSLVWALMMLALCAMSLAAGTYSAFIYFQF